MQEHTTIKSNFVVNTAKKINMMWLSAVAGLTVWVLNSPAFAQNITIGGSGGSGGSAGGATAGKVNELLQWVIDFIVEIGALISVLFALGLILAVKFGMIPAQKIKDWIVVVLAFLVIPWLIPSLYLMAKGL